jgi:FkbM family methyltransferase
MAAVRKAQVVEGPGLWSVVDPAGRDPRKLLALGSSGVFSWPGGAVRRTMTKYIPIDEHGFRFLDLKWKGVFLDIGACAGDSSCRARVCGPDWRVISVEPDDQSFACLAANTAGLDITIVNAALGPIGCDGTRGGILNSRGNHAGRFYGPGDGGVELVSLPGLFERFAVNPRECWLKMDCEGAEWHYHENRWFAKLLRRLAGFSLEAHTLKRRHAAGEMHRWAMSVLGKPDYEADRGKWTWLNYSPGWRARNA